MSLEQVVVVSTDLHEFRDSNGQFSLSERQNVFEPFKPEQAYGMLMDTSELGERRFQRDRHDILRGILQSPEYSRLTLENAANERIGHYRALLFRSAASTNPSEGIKHLYEQPPVTPVNSSNVVRLSDYARREGYAAKN